MQKKTKFSIIFLILCVLVIFALIYIKKAPDQSQIIVGDKMVNGAKTTEKSNIDAPDPVVMDEITREHLESSIQISLDDLDQLLDADSLEMCGRLAFTEIKSDESFRSFLAEYELKESSYELSAQQKDGFIDHLENTCKAYNTGVYDDFMKFRVPLSQYTYDSDKLNWYKYGLLNFYKTPSSEIPEDPEELVKLYWKKNNESEVSFVGLWEAVHTPRVSIKKSKSMPMRLMDMADLLDKSALGGSRLVNFKRDPIAILKKDREIIYTDVEYIVKHKTGLAYPVIIRSFWDTESQKWFPNEILICYTGKGRMIDPEF